MTTGGQCRAFSPFTGADKWTTEGAEGGVAHVFHDAFWGNWQFKIKAVNATSKDITFSESKSSPL